MRVLALSVLVATGCVTTHVVERYPIAGDPAAIDRAAHEAVERLGWSSEAAASGRFRLTRYPRAEATPRWAEPFLLEYSVGPGGLEFEGNRSGGNQTELTEAASILADATRQLLEAKAAPGPTVSPRSAAVAVALDVLLPAAGAVYALGGDPYFDSAAVSASRHFWWLFAARLGMDLLAVEMAGLAVMEAPYGGSSPTVFLVEAAFLVVINRLAAIVEDLNEVPFRNAYARSGLSPPGEGFRR